MKMETRGRSGGFGFPGYDGSLPKAVRSSRGRNEDRLKSRRPACNMGYFELLATVAGQLLQERSIDEQENGNVTKQKNSGRMVGHEEEQEGLTTDEGLKQDLPYEHAGRDDRSCQSKELKHLSALHKEDIAKLEASKVSMQEQAFESEDGLEIAGKSLLHAYSCLQNVEDACSIRVNTDMDVREFARIDGINSCESNCISKVSDSSPAVQKQMDLGDLEQGWLSMKGHPICKEESDANCSLLRDQVRRGTGSFMNVRDSLMLDDENPPLVSSGSSEEALTSVKNMSGIPFEKQLENRQELARLIAKDDDDNSSESIVPETKRSSRASCMKALPPRRLRNGNISNQTAVAGSKRKHGENNGMMGEKGVDLHGNGMACCRQRTPRGLQSREVLQESACVTPELYVNVEGFPDVHGEPPASAAKLRSAKASSAASSPTSATKISWKHANKKLGEPHVKVSITSFTVPELSVDLPETATVANLKRAVMEAAINLLGRGLHVRVLLQGKMVPDESETLVQVGISCKERLDSLGFMLEPSQVPDPPASAEDPLLVLSCAASQPATRYPVFLDGDFNGSTAKSLNGKAIGLPEMDADRDTGMKGQVNLIDQAKRDLEPVRHGSLVQASGALILHPVLKEKEAMALVQMQHGLDFGKRRTRRPFTVAEVEALVHAVEMLGTGRWRDVKLQAFNQAKHRTYVDLKDKWKTLVHTARIAPHQRRGEPVPQELLDRVIQAHTYWTAHQASQHPDLDF